LFTLSLEGTPLSLMLSDIPESTDEELRRARRVGRPATGNAKQLIAIRIAPCLLHQLRCMAARQSKPAKRSSTNCSKRQPAKSPDSAPSAQRSRIRLHQQPGEKSLGKSTVDSPGSPHAWRRTGGKDEGREGDELK
jgi:hypothetical protein